MKKLKKRTNRAAARYLELRGMRLLDRDWKRDGLAGKLDLVAEDCGTLVFATVSVADLDSDAGFREEPLSREQYELLAATWLKERADGMGTDMPIRFDRLSLMVLGDDHAIVRHYMNVLGAPFGSV